MINHYNIQKKYNNKEGYCTYIVKYCEGLYVGSGETIVRRNSHLSWSRSSPSLPEESAISFEVVSYGTKDYCLLLEQTLINSYGLSNLLNDKNAIPQHGTPTKYHKGCRCKLCQEAKRTYSKLHRDNNINRYLYLEKKARDRKNKSFIDNYQTFIGEACNREMNTSSLTYNSHLLQKVLGLSEEVGELSQLFSKELLYGHKISTHDLINELGDIIHYVAAIAEFSGTTLDELLKYNTAKIKERWGLE